MELSEILGKEVGEILSLRHIGVSSFAETYRVSLPDGAELFVKYSTDQPDLIEAERIGLSQIRAVLPSHCPQEIAFKRGSFGALLALPFATIGRWTPEVERAFGKALAKLHRATTTSFGFATDNFIGATPQYNTQTDRWGDFYVEQRLLPQLSFGKRNGWVTQAFDKAFQGSIESVREYLNAHAPSPSLCHGDLWNGNALPIQGEGSWFIDPAVYFGDRETDLAFMQLFGGFSAQVFEGYQAEYLLPKDAEERVPLYNLYHVMNHANLFGGSYVRSAENLLRSKVAPLVAA